MSLGAWLQIVFLGMIAVTIIALILGAMLLREISRKEGKR